MGVAAKIGPICREARQGAGLQMLEIAQAAGISETTVSRFERNQRWPRDVDALVDAYERECQLANGELWRRAVDDQ